MQGLGHVSQFPQLLALWLAITQHRPEVRFPDGTCLATRRFKEGKLFGIDYQGKRYVEQNPETHSAYAARARRGSKIVWVIDLRTNQYLGRIDEEQVHLATRTSA